MRNFYVFLKEYDTTLRYHKNLNPKIWDRNEKLKPDLKDLLLKRAYEFADFSGIDRNRIKDIVFTGSNANRNYTKFSDNDVHLMCDQSGLSEIELYKKKVEWTKNHKDDNYEGYPIEMYAQDHTEHWPEGQGVYSIVKDEWIIKPVNLGTIEALSDPKIADKIKHEIRYVIRHLLSKKSTIQDILDFKEKMWKGRQAGLSREGEFSVENMVYKSLRNKGYIAKINDKLEQLSGEI